MINNNPTDRYNQGGISGTTSCPPPSTSPNSEPSLGVKASELLDHLNALQLQIYALNDRLFGPIPSDGPMESLKGAPLATLLAIACQCAANLVGFMMHVNTRS